MMPRKGADRREPGLRPILSPQGGERVTIGMKYVNMADINVSPAAGTGEPDKGGAPAREITFELIELFFFAYRDFVSDPDHVLERFQFGRAHHRVLHFVSRNPGIRVADLLDVLRITKQSLARVLRELVDEGFIAQSTGRSDRRQRLLTVTDKGRTLAQELARLQTDRFSRALSASGFTREEAARFLFAIIDPDGREAVTRLIRSADSRFSREKG